jgi:hypothetical protein
MTPETDGRPAGYGRINALGQLEGTTVFGATPSDINLDGTYLSESRRGTPR